MRKQNYQQQKKTREEARKVRQASKQQRRQAPSSEPVQVDTTKLQPVIG
jgi:hypothetical protein